MPLGNEVRFACRQLRKSPGFTLIVLATLGLCIGANTAIFSVLDAVLLRGAPYPEPEKLALVITHWSREGRRATTCRRPARCLKASATACRASTWRRTPARTARTSPRSGTWNTSGSSVSRRDTSACSAFRLKWDANSLAGGCPGRPGRRRPQLQLLAARLSRRRRSAWPGHQFARRAYTVVGIMPQDFRATGSGGCVDSAAAFAYRRRRRTKLRRRRADPPVATWAAVGEQLRAISPGLCSRGAASREYTISSSASSRCKAASRGMYAAGIADHVGSGLMVLLIGCVNIAGLLLARSAARSREIATPHGVGRRARCHRPPIVGGEPAAGRCAAARLEPESARWRSAGSSSSAPIPSNRGTPSRLTCRVLAATMGIARADQHLLRTAAGAVHQPPGYSFGAGGRRARNGRRTAALVAQYAGGLRSRVEPGAAGRRGSAGPHAELSEWPEPRLRSTQCADRRVRCRTRGIRRRRRSIGCTRRASTGSGRSPAWSGRGRADAALRAAAERSASACWKAPTRQRHCVETVYTTAGYFETLRIPLIAGRTFRESDTHESAKVAVVSQSFVKRYLKARTRSAVIWRARREIVGVVGDVQQHSGLGNFGPISIEPTLYLPVSQTNDAYLQMIHTWFAPKWVIRASGPIGGLPRRCRPRCRRPTRCCPSRSSAPSTTCRPASPAMQRYHAALFSILAGLALLLAAIGLYGLISQSITQRTHELGIRLALGATAGQAIGQAMRPGILLAAAGVSRDAACPS